MDFPPKEAMMGVVGAESKTAQVLVKVKDAPESVPDLHDRIAKSGARVRQSSYLAVPGEKFAVFNAFVTLMDPEATGEKLAAALAESSYVLEAHSAEGREYGVLDTLTFPMMWGGKRIVYMNQRAIAGVFEGIQKTFGSGGDVILYQAGSVYGRQFQEGMIKAVGKEVLLRNRGYSFNLMAAAGWGVAELVQMDNEATNVTVRVSECFECEGTKSQAAACSFVRGVLVGASETLLGGTTESEETSCIAKGDRYCEFELRRV